MYKKRLQTDVAFFTVTPMDKYGNFNLSTSCSKLLAEKETARKIVVEVNSSLPYCHSAANNNIHISEADFIVEGNNSPIMELKKPPVTDIDRKIASLIMEEMEDGACLQLGIGGMPNTVGEMIAQSDLRDLGVHTEMLVDSYVDMYEAGRITNRAKNVFKDKFIYTFAMGTRRLYDFLDDNSQCLIMPVDYTNDPFIIAQNDKVVSLCSCLEVDILGQVSSESIGFRHISGTGGQLDFHFASFRSKGGKGFLCMPSTSRRKDGTVESKIVPCFKPGTVVTVPSAVTNYVVTEYGIVNLKGKSTWERAEALISIAHPDFRDELIRVAQENRIWLPRNKSRI
jgi:acyl-CoA hydrolase